MIQPVSAPTNGGPAARAQAFLQAEQLGEGDSWFCGRCRGHVQARKKLDLWRLPELLVVLIKRFEHARGGRVKLDAPVSFPLSGLNLAPYVAQPQARQNPHNSHA